MTCKDCVHYEVCAYRASQFKSVGVEVDWDEENSADVCMMSRNKSRFVELPCEVGQKIYNKYSLKDDILYWEIERIEIYEDEIDFVDDSGNYYTAEDFGKIIFFSLEEAKKALAEPTADVVEVVRCKDCKHWMKDVAGCTDVVGRCEWANYMVGANGYCVYVEKALKERDG